MGSLQNFAKRRARVWKDFAREAMAGRGDGPISNERPGEKFPEASRTPELQRRRVIGDRVAAYDDAIEAVTWFFRSFAIATASSRASAVSARSSRTESSPVCRALPLAAARVFPAAVLGPVECSQGRFACAASRKRCRLSGDSGLRFNWFSLPASCRGEGAAVDDMIEKALVVTNHFVVSVIIFIR